MISPVKIVRPSPRLARFVSALWDWEVPEGNVFTKVQGRILPSVSPLLVVHYRAPQLSDRRRASGPYNHVMIGIQTETIAVRPQGPVGSFKVRFKPESLPMLLRSSLCDLRDSEVQLEDVLPSSAVRDLVERIALARGTDERVAVVEQFLYAHMSTDCSHSIVEEAAFRLRTRPTLTVKRLCEELSVDRRQLLRKFRAVFGLSPKHFAKLQRLNHVLCMRRNGAQWADIACVCGYADQAHLIKDFNDLVGRSPEDFFRSTVLSSVRGLNESFGRAGFCNTFAEDSEALASSAS